MPCSLFLLVLICRPPRPTLFPYTTLFRSRPPLLHSGGPHVANATRVTVAIGRKPGRRGHHADRRERDRHRGTADRFPRSEEHTSELQSLRHLVCRLLLEKKKKKQHTVMRI